MAGDNNSDVEEQETVTQSSVLDHERILANFDNLNGEMKSRRETVD